MADSLSGITNNPFTGKVFTDAEIKHLDTDNNGVISDDELTKGLSWLSGLKDDDEEATIGDMTDSNKDIYNNAKDNGLKDSANTVAELADYLYIIQDAFFVEYFNNNPNITADEKTSIEAYVGTKTKEYINEISSGSQKPPYNMKDILTKYTETMNKALVNRSNLLTSVNNKVDDLKNTDGRFEKLVQETKDATSNYYSDAAYNKTVLDTTKYILGELLNENDISDFLKLLNSNYSNNKSYQELVSAIARFKNATTPEEMQTELDKATAAATELVKSAGKTQLSNAIIETNQSKAETALETQLTEIAEKLIEATIAQNPGMDENSVNTLAAFVKSFIPKYISELAEKNENLRDLDVTNLAQDFALYVAQKQAELINAQNNILTKAAGETSAFNILVAASDAAKADKYITGEEKESIVNAGVEFIMSQLLNNVEPPALLNKLNSNYATNSNFVKVKQLMSEIANETDAEVIDKKMEEAKKLLTEILNTYSGDTLTNAIDGLKAPEVNKDMKEDIINDSSIASFYQANASRTSDYGKQNDESLNNIQEQAKKDMEAIAEQIKAKMKAELGSAYDEAEIDRYISDAMNDTIAKFTLNVSRRNGKGNYNSSSDHVGFEFLRRSGSHKGRYTYNVQALVNTFLQNFNATSNAKHAAKLDPSLATYDKENVINETLGNDYYRNKSVTKDGKSNDNNTYAELIEEAKADLKKVAAAMKASMISEGVPLTSSEMDKIIEDCIGDTIEDMKKAFQKCSPGGTNTGGGISACIGSAALGTSTAIWGSAAGSAIGAWAAGTTVANVAAVEAGTAAMGAATLVGTQVAGVEVVMTGTQFTTATTIASAVPIVGWAVAGVAAVLGGLALGTNLFGATYGKHDTDAGFYFERKSHSHSGRWGYDTKTLVDLFMAKVDKKVAEAKEANKNKKDVPDIAS